MVEDIRAGGATSLRAIAAELNDRGMLTRRGGRWHVSTVMNLLDRLGLQGGGMRQSRLMSFVEAMANVVVGYGVAVLVQIVVFPVFGIAVSVGQNLRAGLVFTAVSIARSFLLQAAVRSAPAKNVVANPPPRPHHRLIAYQRPRFKAQ